MNKIKFFLVCALLFLAPAADAATCFWVGGTGLWSTSNTASWASSSGGTTGTCAATGGVPKNAGDNATFDASSGGGTVTVDTTMNGLSIGSFTMGAFTGTITFATNNPNMTFSGTVSLTGTGTRTLTLGSSILTLTTTGGTGLDASTTTNLTFNANTSTIRFSGASGGCIGANPGNLTYATIAVITTGTCASLGTSGTIGPIGTLSVAAGTTIFFSANVTISNALSIAGASTGLATIMNTSNNNTFTVPAGSTCNWCLIRGLNASNAITATNSFSGGGNTNVNVTNPSASRIIGG